MSLMNIFKRDNLVSRNTSLMDGFFDNDIFEEFSSVEAFPRVNVSEKDKVFSVEVAAPGLEKDDFNIIVEDGYLIISATTKNEMIEEKNSYTKREFNYQKFRRSFRLPENADQDEIMAEYKKGILTINIRKNKQIQLNRKKIEVE